MLTLSSKQLTMSFENMSVTNQRAQIVEDIENYYHTHNIHKSIIFCPDDEYVNMVEKLLTDNNHSVCTVCHDELVDDRETYINRIKNFYGSTTHRIMIISYPIWLYIVPELEVFVLPEQNLVVFINISEAGITCIRNWLIDANKRGFIIRDDSDVLCIGCDDYII